MPDIYWLPVLIVVLFLCWMWDRLDRRIDGLQGRLNYLEQLHDESLKQQEGNNISPGVNHRCASISGGQP